MRRVVGWLRVRDALASAAVACWAGTAAAAAPPGDAQATSPAGVAPATPSHGRRDADAAYLQQRGLEQVPKEGNAARTAARTALFVPRTILDGLTYAMAFGAHVGTESAVPGRLHELLSFYHSRIGVHPLLSFNSGARTEHGAEVGYRLNPFGAAISGLYGNRDNWGTKLDLVTDFTRRGTPAKIRGSAFINERDDFEFHGFGSHPRSDPRNHFRPGAREDFGVYAQRLSRVSIVAGVRPWTRWQFFYTGLYQERRVRDPRGGADDDLSDTFDVSTLPGSSRKSQQIYQEGGIRFDTRKYDRKISPGFRLEAYAGLANGVGDDKGRFRRLGVDVSPYLPVLHRDRLIVPRFILDTVDDLNEDVPLAFTDYPRQPAFRGASRTELLRTDEFSAVPSLEYQWLLTHNVSGQLFLDYLLVADSLRHLTVADAPYAYGVGIAIQGARGELGRIAVSTGSEGARLMIDLGLSTHTSDRTRWQ